MPKHNFISMLDDDDDFTLMWYLSNISGFIFCLVLVRLTELAGLICTRKKKGCSLLKDFFFYPSWQLVLRYGTSSWSQDWLYSYQHADTCYWRHGLILLNRLKQPISRLLIFLPVSLMGLIDLGIYGLVI